MWRASRRFFSDRSAFDEWLNKAAQSRDPLFFAAVDQTTRRAEGRLALMRIDCVNGVIEIGHILFGPRLAKKHAAIEAILLVGCYVFDELKYRRMEWKCDARNEASKHAATRFGFTFEGVFRQHMVVKGENRDIAWFDA